MELFWNLELPSRLPRDPQKNEVPSPPRTGERGCRRSVTLRCNHEVAVATALPPGPSIAVWISDALIPKPTPTSLASIKSGRAPPVWAGGFRRGAGANPVSSFPRLRVLRGQPTNSHFARAGFGEKPCAPRSGGFARAAPKGKTSAAARPCAAGGRCVKEPGWLARGCPGATRRSLRSRASGGSPRGWRLAAPPAIPKSPSQPEGCSEVPAVNLSLLLRFGRSCCLSRNRPVVLAVHFRPGLLTAHSQLKEHLPNSWTDASLGRAFRAQRLRSS